MFRVVQSGAELSFMGYFGMGDCFSPLKFKKRAVHPCSMDGPKYTKFNIFSDIYTPFQEIHPEVFRRPMYQGHPDASHREIFSWVED